MITIFQAIILGLLQGASELFPISSLGHSVVLPRLFGWDIHQNDNAFLIFLVATHLATALVLLAFYRRTWVRILRGLGRSIRDGRINDHDNDAKLGWLLVLGTIPAGLLGILFQDQIRSVFVTAASAAAFLIVNGLILLGAEQIRRRAPTPAVADDASVADERLAAVGWKRSLRIGSVQAIALIPGLSRSGAAISGGLLSGLTHEDAAHFAFLLATPIIFAAAVLKLPELAAPQNHALVGPSVIGGICAAISAYVAVRFLTRYFEKYSLRPFGIYCIIFGGICSLLFVLGR